MLVCGSGHGYLDLSAYEQHLDGVLSDQPPAPEALRLATAGLGRVEQALAAAAGRDQ